MMGERATAHTIAVIEIGGTTVKIGFAIGGEPIDQARTFPTSEIRTTDPVAALADLARAGFDALCVGPDCIVATAPGFLARDFDHVLHAANVPELNGRRLATELARALGAPVVLERDVVLQLLGEIRAGAGIGENHVLGVFFGTGIGASTAFFWPVAVGSAVGEPRLALGHPWRSSAHRRPRAGR